MKWKFETLGKLSSSCIFVDVCEIHNIIDGCESSKWSQNIIKYPFALVCSDLILSSNRSVCSSSLTRH